MYFLVVKAYTNHKHDEKTIPQSADNTQRTPLECVGCGPSGNYAR